MCVMQVPLSMLSKHFDSIKRIDLVVANVAIDEGNWIQESYTPPIFVDFTK